MSDANVSLPDPIAPPDYAPAAVARPKGDGFWGKDGMSFSNLIDVINPLQHIPVVGSIYRAVTGDQISPGARLAGGTLFGGPIGFAASVANLVMEDVTGTDLAKSAVALVRGEREAPVQVAAAATPVNVASATTVSAAPAESAAASMRTPPATIQSASLAMAPGTAPQAPVPWSAVMAPAALMPPAAHPGNIAGVMNPTAGAVSAAQKDALFAKLAGQSAALPAATPDTTTILDAAKKDAIFAKLAGQSVAMLPASGAPDTAEAWRPTVQPKMSAPIRPKLRGAPVAAYAVAPRPMPAAAVAAETQGVQSALAAPAAASPMKAVTPGGYTAQELLQMYQRYQNPGARPAAGNADTNS